MSGTRRMNLDDNGAGRRRSLRKGKPRNPLQRGVQSFLETLPSSTLHGIDVTAIAIPGRYTLYPPLLLLPVNFATHNVDWQTVYSKLDASRRAAMFTSIVGTFVGAGQEITHVAINAAISAFNLTEDAPTGLNVLRSPSRLVPVYGDFGPSTLHDRAAFVPTQQDFEAAFWVSTQQSQRVSQVWAPRWSMFSRGNITEKNRILGEGNANVFPGMTASELGVALPVVDVVDLYVGIGYFAFSYLARGVNRLWGWDLNPWSIEGLRRGCEANGWRCLVVRVSADGKLDDTSINELAQLLYEHDANDRNNPIRCVAFLGDNKHAASTMTELRSASTTGDRRDHVRHVNLGLLPSSKDSWEGAVRLIDCASGGWLHVHENVDIHQIHTRSWEIVAEINILLARHKPGRWQAVCQHVERVKTYAPGVMHCVFDIKIQPAIK